jgi:hypothetical protein
MHTRYVPQIKSDIQIVGQDFSWVEFLERVMEDSKDMLRDKALGPSPGEGNDDRELEPGAKSF